MGDSTEQLLNKLIQEFANELVHHSHYVRDYCDIGYDEATRIRKTKKMIEMNHREIRREKKELLEEVEQLGHEFLTLRSDLGCSVSDPDESLSILELRTCLLEKNSVLGELKDKRMAQYDILKQQEEALSKAFGCASKGINYNVAPSEEQMREYKVFLDSRRNELARRRAMVDEAKPLLVTLMNDLDWTLQNKFQHELLFGKEFTLSDENLEELKRFKQQVESESEKCKRKVLKFKDRVSSLWNFLQVSKDEQESFLANFDGKQTVAVLAMLEKEISRCQELKLANIGKYILNIREEIEKYWESLFYNDEQKQSFKGFNSDDFTEELLSLHEEELNTLKEKYSVGQEIFAAFKNRMELWDKMKEMESKANDPKRFNNRGGKLLAEEKERAKLMNLLPKIEQKLMEMAVNWESNTGRRFSVYGESLPDFVKQQWDRREQDKENEKLERRAKNQQMMDEMLNGFGSVNRTASCKRPREACGSTPVRCGTSKMQKTNLLTPINSHTNINIMSSCGKLPSASTSKVQPSSTANNRIPNLPTSRRLFTKKVTTGRLISSRTIKDNRRVIVDETNPFSVSIESTNSEFQRKLKNAETMESTRK